MPLKYHVVLKLKNQKIQKKKDTTSKDVALYIMAQMTTSGATGYAVEYAGEVVRNMSMEGRLTLSNLSIEMGSRAGLIAPDETTFAYLKGREYAPKGAEGDKAVEEWKKLKSDDDAVFDKETSSKVYKYASSKSGSGKVKRTLFSIGILGASPIRSSIFKRLCACLALVAL